MQQGGGGGHQSQFGEMSGGPTTSSQLVSEQSEQLEEASPISYRAAAAIGNPDELIRLASSNRWPHEETLALLKIRSDMDGAFRDATVKGPIWEDVSRKLAEVGYKRSAKKCKEKFENVHKYYKRTKDVRTGRHDGKTYKFFSELEALHSTCAPATLDVAPISVGIPMPVSSVKIPPTTTVATTIPVSFSMLPTPGSAPAPRPTPTPVPTTPFGIRFSSNSSSSSQGLKDEDELGGEPSDMAGTSRKRKIHSSSRKMMEFLEGLMKQVLQKQEALQQMFLEAMEKREQDRMIREEAWKRQELARLAREHELIAQERALASSRDAAIVFVLQKITGHTIQLPPAAPPSQTQPAPQVVPPPTPIPAVVAPLPQQPENIEVVPIPSQVIMAIPEQKEAPQEISGSESMDPASSRWPKAEVLALINLRSGLESRYQEAGPKGPLWEDISAGMSRMGYKRSAKRCKEKWENINKYFKKVKERNKQRPEDAKTCPYFHQLDALYCKKTLGGGTSGGSSSISDHNRLEGETSQPSATPPITEAPPLSQQPIHDQSENKTGAIVDVRTSKAKKSEDIVRELMEDHEMQ